ncbi:MAG TPA: molybdopterin biosynthesis protein [Caldilineae bacterium]|nr:molybdopterin biosynthesis protein [Caldilineae bacterium]HIQ11349.1 molybdopterin biosynthesis protein [Caldilineales bacterium]
MPTPSLLPLTDALARWREALEAVGAFRRLPAESVPVAQAHGRVTAVAVWARISSPHYHAVAMDGYVVRSAMTANATPARPVRLRLGEDAWYVNTGDALPQGFDAVIPQEEARAAGGWLEVSEPIPAWSHVRLIGEDMAAAQLVAPAYQRLRPQDLGAIAGSGHRRVQVFRQPRIAILPLGERLIPPDPHVGPGQIIEFNSIVLAAMAREWGAAAHPFPPQDGDLETLFAQVEAALDDHDLVVLNAGASGGARDHAERIIRRLGEVTVRGVALRPGHAVILGHARSKPIVAIPGFPVSAMTALEQIVRPLLEGWLGQSGARAPELQALLPQAMPSDPAVDDFKRVVVAHTYRGAVARELPQAAGAIMTMVRADGVIHIPRGQTHIPAASLVQVALLRPPETIAHTLIHIGSHDLALDILADQLRRAHPDRFLNSLGVDSLEGLHALARGEAHFAGVHLLDPTTGVYNIPAVQRVLPHLPVVVMRFVRRAQGLILPRGNPKRIHTLADLARPDVTFINRQPGSGARQLLDYHLQRQGIAPDAIRGYDRIEHAHLAVAAAVKNGIADAGLGVLTAARALDLDFIPLFLEDYDLVMPVAHYESELLAPILRIIATRDFRQTVAALGGYEVDGMGEIIHPLP